MHLEFFAVNLKPGPEGLCPMILVYGAMKRPAIDVPVPKQMEGAQEIEAAMKDTEK